VSSRGQASTALQSLQVLTGLVDMRLAYLNEDSTYAGVLSGSHHLTRLEMDGCWVDPASALGAKPKLQHPKLESFNIAGGAAGVPPAIVQLMSQLQQLQEVTYLGVQGRLDIVDEVTTPPAAFSALTASSKLQHLQLDWCSLPEGVWQHMFFADRKLPYLQYLNIAHTGGHAAPSGSLLSGCPGLTFLSVAGLRYYDAHHGTQLLATYSQLPKLHTLCVAPADPLMQGLEAVWQVTGLKKLVLRLHEEQIDDPEGLLLQLTQLKNLTQLHYNSANNGNFWPVYMIQVGAALSVMSCMPCRKVEHAMQCMQVAAAWMHVLQSSVCAGSQLAILDEDMETTRCVWLVWGHWQNVTSFLEWAIKQTHQTA
jgi:hypothetical protein